VYGGPKENSRRARAHGCGSTAGGVAGGIVVGGLGWAVVTEARLGGTQGLESVPEQEETRHE